MHRITGEEYLFYLQNHKLVNDHEATLIKKSIVKNAQQPGLPFYFHLLAGIGTLISTLCLFAILYLFGFISFINTEGFLTWGIVFVIFAILIYFQFKNNIVNSINFHIEKTVSMALLCS